MAGNLPLTVESALAVNFSFGIVYGANSVPYPSTPQENQIWFAVLDRSTLQVVFNVMTTTYNAVPAGLAQYNTDANLLVVATCALGTLNVPQGPLYDFLVQVGAGVQLARLAQISTQLGCGEISVVAYNLVTVLGTPEPGFESAMLQGSVITGQNWVGYEGGPGPIQTLTLMAQTIGGQTVYTPITLSP